MNKAKTKTNYIHAEHTKQQEISFTNIYVYDTVMARGR